MRRSTHVFKINTRTGPRARVPSPQAPPLTHRDDPLGRHPRRRRLPHGAAPGPDRREKRVRIPEGQPDVLPARRRRPYHVPHPRRVRPFGGRPPHGHHDQPRPHAGRPGRLGALPDRAHVHARLETVLDVGHFDAERLGRPEGDGELVGGRRRRRPFRVDSEGGGEEEEELGAQDSIYLSKYPDKFSQVYQH